MKCLGGEKKNKIYSKAFKLEVGANNIQHLCGVVGSPVKKSNNTFPLPHPCFRSVIIFCQAFSDNISYICSFPFAALPSSVKLLTSSLLVYFERLLSVISACYYSSLFLPYQSFKKVDCFKEKGKVKEKEKEKRKKRKEGRRKKEKKEG